MVAVPGGEGYVNEPEKENAGKRLAHVEYPVPKNAKQAGESESCSGQQADVTAAPKSALHHQHNVT